MLNNYFNPQGMDPGVGWKPQGALGGMLYADREAKYQDAVSLQDAMARISTQMEQEKLNTYKADEGVRSAERPAKISGFGVDTALNNQRLNTPNFASTMVGGQMGEAQTKQAKGQFDVDTLSSKTDATNVENVVKGLEGTGRMLEMSIAAHPMLGQLEYQSFLEKVPPGLKQMLPTNYTPEVPQILKKLSEAITQSPEHRRTMEGKRLDRDSAERVAKGNNETSIKVAEIRAAQQGARIKSLMQQFEAAKTPEQASFIGANILMIPDLDDQDRKRVQAMVDRANNIIAEKMAKGGFDISSPQSGPGVLSSDVLDRLQRNPGGASQAPSTGVTKEGYQILGRNPDGTIRIRDPKTGRTGTMRP